MGSYIPASRAEQEAMLAEIGLNSFDALYAVVPEEVRLKTLHLPEGMTELEVSRKVSAMAERNQRFHSIFRGAGAYDHYIPSIVRTITSKEEFVTAYTPYQAEISQGVLQSIFEYQTQICELTGMEVSNASVYDGATAAAEAVFMCQERKKSGVILSDTVDPQIRMVLETYCESRGVPVTVIPAKNGMMDLDALDQALQQKSACVLVQNPNFYGILEPVDSIISAAHQAGAKVIMSVNPISLGLLKTPGEYGADIAVGEGQPLGLPMGFGGPYLGFMTCKKAMMRKLPGRIVGETVDAKGRRCFVLTLQAREQHIRREKASSNICSNEALCAMTASVYLAAVGPKGLEQAAESSAAYAHYFAEKLSELGFQRVYDAPFFHEFLTECPQDPETINARLAEHGILGGLPVDGKLLWCCTEKTGQAAIDRMITILKEVCKG